MFKHNADGTGPTPESGGDKPQTKLAVKQTSSQKATNSTSRYTSGSLKKGAGSLGGKNR